MTQYQVFRDANGQLTKGATVYACPTDDINSVPALDANVCYKGVEVQSGVYRFNLEPDHYYYYYVDGIQSGLPIYMEHKFATYYVILTLDAGLDTVTFNYSDMTDIYGRSISTALIAASDTLLLNIARYLNGRRAYISKYTKQDVTLAKESIGSDDASEILLEIKIGV